MILVTGGAGFIGSALVEYLNQKGESDIIIVDRLRAGDKWKNIRSLKFKEFIHADELFLAPYVETLTEVSVIYHLGACSATTMMDMDYLMKNNVEYTQKLIKLAQKNNIPIIFASSAATYGRGESGFSDDLKTLNRLKPLNPYGLSKHVVDLWMNREDTVKPQHWFSLKFFNVYGPNEYHKGPMRSLVHKMFHTIKNKEGVSLFKSHHPDFQDGMQLRDFIYVKDVVAVMVQLASKKMSKHSGIYNLGSGVARSFNDLALNTYSAMQLSPQIKYIDMPENIRGQYQYYTCADMTKLHSILPDFKFTTLEDGVFDYVQKYLLHHDAHLGDEHVL